MEEKSKTEQMAEITQLLKEVNYTYINSTGVTATNWDVRIAFGDRLPSDKIDPKFGVIMSHEHARIFIKVMSETIKQIQAQLAQAKDEDVIKSSS